MRAASFRGCDISGSAAGPGPPADKQGGGGGRRAHSEANMRELAATARQWAAQGRAAVLARPLSERGFGPRHPADAILVDEDGDCRGRLYRGAFDRQLAAEAASLPPGHTARVVAVAV